MAEAATEKPAKKHGYSQMWGATVPNFLTYTVLLLAFGLIAFISWDTYKGIDFLENRVYMLYQFITCMVFLAEYFYMFFMSHHKLRFFIFAMPFLLISIPYLNLVVYFGISVPHKWLALLCFIPILRGLFGLVMVVNYVSKNVTTTVFASYMLVLVPIVYMSGLIFYIAEHDINAAIKNFWYALWWAGMCVTTIGCDINPVTATGMILSFLLSLLGIIMFPLFTIYFGDVIKIYSHKENAKD